MLAGYASGLRWVLARQGLTLAVAVATLLLAVFLYIIVPKGFLPRQDTGAIQAMASFVPAA